MYFVIRALLFHLNVSFKYTMRVNIKLVNKIFTPLYCIIQQQDKISIFSQAALIIIQ